MDANASMISSWVPPTAQEIQSARAQLVAEEGALHLLLAQVEATRGRIAALKLVIAPIRRVPPEILAEIITLSATAPGAPAWVLRALSSVCRFWRDTTLRTPQAWSKIHFKGGNWEDAAPGTWLRTLPEAREWFKNSGKTKKDVRVDFKYMKDEDIAALMDLIAAHSEQLRTLAVDGIRATQTRLDEIVGMADQTTMLKTLFTNPMPCLEDWSFYDFEKSPIIPQRSTAPNLRRMFADVEQLLCMSPVERGELSRLTIFPKKSFNLARFVSLSDKGDFPALRVLAIQGKHRLPQFSRAVSITLPSLEAFHMDFDTDNKVRMAGLFSCLKMPNLATLSLASQLEYFESIEDSDESRDESTKLAKILLALIATSAPPLQRLYLQGMSLFDWDLVEVLDELPLIERLVLACLPITNDFATSLGNRWDSDGPVCPRLTHLFVSPVVRDPRLHRVSLRAMAAAIQDRAAAAAEIPGGAAKVAHVRIDHSELVEVDGRLSWSTDDHWDGIRHPAVFRDAYVPCNRWWHMNANIIGSGLEGL